MWDGKLNRFINRFDSFVIGEEVQRITSRSNVRKWIKDANRMRLFKYGKDTQGKKIRTYKAAPGQVYALSTLSIKRESNLPVNRVTLFQTGAFHRSIKTKTDRKGFEVRGQFQKRKGNMAESVDTKQVLGLSSADRKKYASILRTELFPIFRRRIIL